MPSCEHKQYSHALPNVNLYGVNWDIPGKAKAQQCL